MELFPNEVIVTCDDDTFYPPWFLEKIYAAHRESTTEIIAYRCSCVKKESDNILSPYSEWKPASKKSPINNLFFTGVGGVLYPPNSLHSDVLKREIFMRLAPTGDDIWFNAMALLKRSNKRLVFDETYEFPAIIDSQIDALKTINVDGGRNDEQLRNVFNHYGLCGLLD